MASVTLNHIYKVYPNGVKAVNDFCMDIQDKEFIVFVGPSGCGKSTTLRMIAGLEDITAGELKIGDLVVNDMEPKDRDIAMVFQNYALYPHMTIYENIAFGLRLRKMPKDEIHRRVLEAANILGITEYLDRKPKEMSGGQRQRVSLGRAIVREPKVMLLDEPLSNLDAKLRTQMRSEISKLHAKLNTTFIYVTHDQIEAMTMGTRIVVMRDGFVQQIDTPKNLYNYPGNKFVAGFIGTPQMNFFEGTLEKKGDEVTVKFAYTDEQITVPYELLYKARPAYLDGKTTVYIGLRAEDIFLEGDPRRKTCSEAAKVKVKISHTEELGNETLVYGDLNMEGDGYVESSTRIIIKVADGDTDFRVGEIVETYLDISKVHLFDKQTEESVLPRIPEYNYVDCNVSGGKLTFLGKEVILPPAIKCDDGDGELLIPTDAVTLGGDIKADVIGCENINGKYLLSMRLGTRCVYAVVPYEVNLPTVDISIDPTRISILRGGKEIVSAMPRLVSLKGGFRKITTVKEEEVNGKTKKRKVKDFVLAVEDAQFPASDETAQKLFSAMGVRHALTKALRFECSCYDLTVGDEGISATVEEIVDYGKEKFAKCKIGENSFYVLVKEQVEGVVKLMPDLSRLAIIDDAMDVRMV